MITRYFCFTVVFLVCFAGNVSALDHNSELYKTELIDAALEPASCSKNIESHNAGDELAEKPQTFAVKICLSWRRSRIHERACAANKRVLLKSVELYNEKHESKMNKLDIRRLIEEGFLKGEVKCPSVSEDAYVGYSLADPLQLDEGSIICLYHGSIKNPVDNDSLGTDKAILVGLPPGSRILYSTSILDADSMKMIVLLSLKWIVFPLVFSFLYIKTFKSLWPRFFHALFLCLGISASFCVLFSPLNPVSRFAGDFFDVFAVYDILMTWLIAIIICSFSSSVLGESYKMLLFITIFVTPLIMFFAPALIPFVSLCVILSELVLIVNIQHKK